MFRAHRLAVCAFVTALSLLTVGLGATPASAATPNVFLISATALDFGATPVGGTSPGQSIAVKNVSTSPVVVSMAGGAAGDFGGSQDCQGNTLATGASCHITYAFTPTAVGPATGSTSGTINGQHFAFSFTGQGTPGFLISPTSFDFGNVPLGSPSPPQTVTITNRTGAPAVMSGAGGAAGIFGGSQNCQSTTLANGASCQMSYVYTPTALGAQTGSTNGSWNGQPFSLTFKGVGVPRFRISPTAFDFGEVQSGTTSAAQTVTVTNLGSTAVVMSGAGGGAGIFGGSQNCQGVSLAAGASCQMQYAFSPASVGAQTGSTSGTWNGQQFALSFAGTGTATSAKTKTFLISPTAFDFGQTPLNEASPTGVVTITNVSSSSVVMSGAGGGAGVFGGSQDCQGTTLAAGASCHMNYAFTPTALDAQTGSTSGSWNGQSFSLAFAGAGAPRFLIAATSLDFGAVPVGGDGLSQTITITNLGSTAATMSGAGGGAGVFGGSQNCQSTSVPGGGSCQMSYRFTPTATGDATGSTSGTWNSQPFALTFTGSATPRFLISPTALEFGDTTVGSTAPGQTVAITNLSAAAAVMNGAGGGAGVFGGSQDCQGTSLASGSSCHQTYAFAPTAIGAQSGTGSGTWNGQSYSVALSGTATQTPGSAGEFVPVTPERLLDTRHAVGFTGGKPGPGAVVTLQVTGAGATAVPSDAAAVVLSVTATQATAAGFVTVWPCGATRPVTSTLNVAKAGTIANLAVARIGTGGTVCLYTNAGTHLLADVQGYYPSTSSIHAVVPERLLDTRNHTGFTGAKPVAGTVIPLQVTGAGTTAVASDAAAVVLNVTATAATTAGYVTAYPCGSARPVASNVNVAQGATVPNLVVVQPGAGGKVCLFTSGGAHVLADIVAWHPNGTLFHAVLPQRLLDTRNGTGHAGAKPAAGAVVEFAVAGVGAAAVPSSASAVILNITATAATAAGYVTAYACGTRPDTSNLNVVKAGTIAVLSVARLSVTGTVCLYTSGGAHLVADVAGYYPG